MKNLIVLILSVGLLVMGVPYKTQATIIRVTFSGTLGVGTGPDDLRDEIPAGTLFSGHFLYDTNSPIIYQDDTMKVYSSSDYSVFLEIVGASKIFALSSPLSAGILTPAWTSGYICLPFIMGWTGLIAGYEPDEATIELYGGIPPVSNDTLPYDMDSGTLWIANLGNPAAGFEIGGSFETVTAHPLPEPTTIILSGFGLLGLAGLRYKFWKALIKRNGLLINKMVL